MYRYIKRFIDLTLSLLGILFLLPLYLILTILVRIKLGSPIFFIQERSTLNGRSFSLLKFRTMTNKTDSDGNLLPDELRKTSFGSWLRSNRRCNCKIWRKQKGYFRGASKYDQIAAEQRGKH